MTKAPDKKTPANGIAVERLPMDAICGLHPAIEQLFDKLSIPPFRIAPKRLIDKRDLMRLLDVVGADAEMTQHTGITDPSAC